MSCGNIFMPFTVKALLDQKTCRRSQLLQFQGECCRYDLLIVKLKVPELSALCNIKLEHLYK